MEVDEKPTEDYNDVGGLDKQIEEMVEAIVLPMTQADKFKNIGIKPPKGKLSYIFQLNPFLDHSLSWIDQDSFFYNLLLVLN